jgi:hypothetical protein
VSAIEELVYGAVTGNAGITSLLNVDSAGNPAFYLVQLPQQNVTSAGAACYPAGVQQRVSSPRMFILAPGASLATAQASIGKARFQFTFWGYDAGVLTELDAAVLAMLRTFDAFNPPGSPATTVQPGFISYSSRYSNEPQTQPVLQRVDIDVIFWFSDQA